MRPIRPTPSLAPRPDPLGPHRVPALRAGDRPASGDAGGGRAADTEVSIRRYADGTQISVVRRTVADGDGRRTVGIDAVIR